MYRGFFHCARASNLAVETNPVSPAYTSVHNVFIGAAMNPAKSQVEIEYCNQCRHMLRASWMAQELLTTFADELSSVALVPGSGGIFEVRMNGQIIFSKKDAGRFPESKELKQLIRERVAPMTGAKI